MVLVFAVLALVVASAGLFFVVYGRAETWKLIAGDPDLGPFDRTSPARSPTPNDALLCTPGLCDGVPVDAPLPLYAEPPEALIAKIDASIRAVSPHIRRVDDGSDPARARYVTWSPTMRFPDTNSFEAVAMDRGTGLVAYARAQLGRSDIGKNRARLEAVVAAIAD